jgi:hypothetical protein
MKKPGKIVGIKKSVLERIFVASIPLGMLLLGYLLGRPK